VQWRVVALLKAGSEGWPTYLACSVLFCEFNSLWTNYALFSMGPMAPLKGLWPL